MVRTSGVAEAATKSFEIANFVSPQKIPIIYVHSISMHNTTMYVLVNQYILNISYITV